MPGRNRTGPAGMGPMTGRGTGYCSGYSTPGGVNPAFGRGYGLGFGYRGGGGPYRRRPWFGYGYGTSFMGPSRKQEREILQEQATYLEDNEEKAHSVSRRSNMTFPDTRGQFDGIIRHRISGPEERHSNGGRIGKAVR